MRWLVVPILTLATGLSLAAQPNLIKQRGLCGPGTDSTVIVACDLAERYYRMYMDALHESGPEIAQSAYDSHIRVVEMLVQASSSMPVVSAPPTPSSNTAASPVENAIDSVSASDRSPGQGQLGACVTRFRDGKASESNCGSATLRSSLPDDPNPDGCFNANNPPCLQVVSSENINGSTQTTLKNVCARRIYARYCHGTANGPPKCSGSSLEPGQETTSYVSQTDGRVCGVAVGSLNSSRDFLCRAKETDWNRCTEQLSGATSGLVTVEDPVPLTTPTEPATSRPLDRSPTTSGASSASQSAQPTHQLPGSTPRFVPPSPGSTTVAAGSSVNDRTVSGHETRNDTNGTTQPGRLKTGRPGAGNAITGDNPLSTGSDCVRIWGLKECLDRLDSREELGEVLCGDLSPEDTPAYKRCVEKIKAETETLAREYQRQEAENQKKSKTDGTTQPKKQTQPKQETPPKKTGFGNANIRSTEGCDRLVDGRCIYREFSCESGKALGDGSCIPKEWLNEIIVGDGMRYCETRYRLLDSRCIKTWLSCPSGAAFMDGACVDPRHLDEGFSIGGNPAPENRRDVKKPIPTFNTRDCYESGISEQMYKNCKASLDAWLIEKNNECGQMVASGQVKVSLAECMQQQLTWHKKMMSGVEKAKNSKPEKTEKSGGERKPSKGNSNTPAQNKPPEKQEVYNRPKGGKIYVRVADKEDSGDWYSKDVAESMLKTRAYNGLSKQCQQKYDAYLADNPEVGSVSYKERRRGRDWLQYFATGSAIGYCRISSSNDHYQKIPYCSEQNKIDPGCALSENKYSERAS